MKTRSVLVMFAGCIAGVWSGVAADTPSPVFKADFDRSFDGWDANGRVDGTFSVPVLFETFGTYLLDGMDGKAVLVGNGNGSEACHVDFPNRGYLSLEEGSISFWVAPFDWDVKDKEHFHVFFRARGENSNLMVYRYQNTYELMFLLGVPNGPDGKEVNSVARCSVKHWRKGEWHHVVATWKNGSLFLYTDGSIGQQNEVSIPPTTPLTKFGIGGLGLWKAPQDHSLIDDVRIYNRLLTADEVLMVYREKESRAIAASEKAASGSTDFLAPEARRPARPETWKTSRCGAERTTPPPWTEPTWDDANRAFECWGRTYVFGDSGFPGRIVSKGRELLSRPIRLATGSAEASFSEVSCAGRDGEGVNVSASGRLVDFDVEVRVRGEFDGFAWFDVELNPRNAAAAYDGLTLEIPFRKESSTLFDAAWKDYWSYRPGHAGAFASYAEDLYGVQTRSMIVCDGEVGLQWSAEELSDWRLADHKKSLRLEPSEKENRLVITFADHRVVPGKKMHFGFGLQALPVKAMPKDWRHIRALHGKDGFEPWFPWACVHNVPDPEMKADNFDQRFARVGCDKSRRVLWYFAGFSMSPHYPEWRANRYNWSLTPPGVGIMTAPESHEWGYVQVCPGGEHYIDFYVDSMERSVRELKIRGLYFDNQDPQFCHNHRHGHGFFDEHGRLYRTYSLLETRELAKRLYRMFKRICPDGKIMRHMSAKNVMALDGFADYLADGEVYNRDVARHGNYRTVFSPEMVRAKYGSTLYGVARYFIPQFKRCLPCADDPEAWKKDWLSADADARHRGDYRHFVGYMLVHDTLIWENFGVTLGEWFKEQDEFDFDGSERFCGYWDAQNSFTQAERVMTSVYEKPDGSWLAIAFNDTDEEAVVLRKDGSVRATVGPRDYIVLRNDKAK